MRKITVKIGKPKPINANIEEPKEVKVALKDVTLRQTSGTTNHDELTGRDLPDQHPMSSIEGLELALDEKQPIGNYALKEEIPSKTSELENDNEFITKTVSDLVNYYAKQETYSREEIDNKISSIPKFSIEVVDSLPTAGISETTVYLVPSGNEEDNLYTEYIYVNGVWEYLGKQTVDLTGYVKRTELSSYYTKTDIEALIETVRSSIPTKLSQLTEDASHRLVSDSEKQSWNNKQPAGDYVTETELNAKGYAKQTDVNNLQEEIVDLNISKVEQSDLETEVADQLDGVKVDIVQEVLAQLGNEAGSVFGKVNEDGTITITTDLEEGDYTIMYEKQDGTLAEVGVITVRGIEIFSITRTLTGCTSNKTATSIEGGSTWTETIKTNSGYTLSNVTVTMGGVNITNSVYNNGVINITGVSGDIVITATAVLPNYTNQIPISVDTDGSVYNGKGYKESSRFNSSGSIVALTTGTNKAWVTGFIPVKAGDVVRLKNCWIDADGTEAVYGQNYGGMNFVYYDNSKTKLGCITWVRGVVGNTIGIKDVVVDADGNAVQFTIGTSYNGTAFMRFTLAGDAPNAILTVNQEIK